MNSYFCFTNNCKNQSLFSVFASKYRSAHTQNMRCQLNHLVNAISYSRIANGFQSQHSEYYHRTVELNTHFLKADQINLFYFKIRQIVTDLEKNKFTIDLEISLLKNYLEELRFIDSLEIRGTYGEPHLNNYQKNSCFVTITPQEINDFISQKILQDVDKWRNENWLVNSYINKINFIQNSHVSNGIKKYLNQENEHFLFNIVLVSSKLENTQKSASNAITFLNRNGFCFRNKNFSRCKIAGADLSWSNLINVSFEGCDLADVNFSQSNLIDCNFKDCDLENTFFSILPPLVGHKSRINSLSWSPSGKYLATGSYSDSAKELKLWDVANQKIYYNFPEVNNYGNFISFSPCGKFLAYVSHDSAVKIISLEATNNIKTLNGFCESFVYIAYSTSWKYFAAVSKDWHVILWDNLNSQKIVLSERPDTTLRLAFSNDEKILATINNEGIIKLWYLNLYKEHKKIHLKPFKGNKIFFSPCGKFLAVSGHSMKLILLDISSEEVTEISSKVWDAPEVSFSPNGKYLAVELWNSIILFDLALQSKVKHFTETRRLDMASTISWSPQGDFIAVGVDNLSVKMYNLIERFMYTKKLAFKMHKCIKHVLFSKTGRFLAAVDEAGTIYMWRRYFVFVKVIKDNGPLSKIAFSPLETHMACGFCNEMIKLWDLHTGSSIILNDEKVKEKSHFHNNKIGLCFSPCGRYLAFGGQSTRIKFYDMEAQEFIENYGPNEEIDSLSFSPCGKFLALACEMSKIKIWSLEAQTFTKQFDEKQSWLELISFSPCGSYLAIINRHGISLINAENGFEEKKFGKSGSLRRVEFATFTASGKHIISVSEKCKIQIWDVETQKEAIHFSCCANRTYSVSPTPSVEYLASGGWCGCFKVFRIWW
ncbi:unnamed protein product [Blepharisma stoltei]|uniref:Uncharacterized protein n=1 Tax=Blepharisma stoltei TaxID=1481888 RepID=A0AAU9IIP7_9CILI|nr:unnamed protein product [Blepharisma stoltei]